MYKHKGFCIDMKYAAYFLNLRILNWPMGKNIIFEHLRMLQVLQDGKNKNKPYPHYYQFGFFEIISIKKNNKTFNKTVITEKGLNWLIREKRSIIMTNEIEYWKENYRKDYSKFLEQEKNIVQN
ncbi:MAG TPA: phage antirepressor KilAC domain-containing protein [Sediminibacterium sp.]|jgi:phage antirepressor YoqD-like protein|nr:phage antirepressor KilAC domain-containing protein [Sediminibacterium sp.]